MKHWADNELAEPLRRVLDSARTDDDAALERMCARLETALGPAFDATLAGPSDGPLPPAQLRRFRTFAVIAVAAIGVTWWTLAHPAARSPMAELSIPAAPALSSPVAASPALARPVAAAPAHSGYRLPERSTSALEAAPTTSQRAATSRKRQQTPGLAEELDGLAQVRTLLETSPPRALASVDTQQKRFARGALTPERELLRLDALLRLGRTTEAQKLASQLLAAPENHPYKARIAQLLARRL